MNYTKTIREFCLQNKGDLFDVSYMKDAYFEMVPYKTLLKILNRLEEEGIIACIGKGVYLIKKEGSDLDEAIFARYIANEHGMYGGYTLFKNLKIIDRQNKCVEIYTNRLRTRTKTIGNYQLTKIDILFTLPIISMIVLLECIEKGSSIKDASFIKLHEIMNAMVMDYSDTGLLVILDAIPYHYSTMVTLKELLDKKGIQNDCIGIFERQQKK